MPAPVRRTSLVVQSAHARGDASDPFDSDDPFAPRPIESAGAAGTRGGNSRAGAGSARAPEPGPQTRAAKGAQQQRPPARFAARRTLSAAGGRAGSGGSHRRHPRTRFPRTTIRSRPTTGPPPRPAAFAGYGAPTSGAGASPGCRRASSRITRPALGDRRQATPRRRDRSARPAVPAPMSAVRQTWPPSWRGRAWIPPTSRRRSRAISVRFCASSCRASWTSCGPASRSKTSSACA